MKMDYSADYSMAVYASETASSSSDEETNITKSYMMAAIHDMVMIARTR